MLINYLFRLTKKHQSPALLTLIGTADRLIPISKSRWCGKRYLVIMSSLNHKTVGTLPLLKTDVIHWRNVDWVPRICIWSFTLARPCIQSFYTGNQNLARNVIFVPKHLPLVSIVNQHSSFSWRQIEIHLSDQPIAFPSQHYWFE